MKRFVWHGRMVVAVCLTVACVVTAGAAPFVRQRQTLPGELRGLANIRRISLQINPLPAEFREVGLTTKKIMDKAKADLEEAGFEIADFDVTPRLVFTALALTDQTVPDAIGFVVFLDIQQHVRILRLEQELIVPTATLSDHGLKKYSALSTGVMERIEATIGRFIAFEKQATKNR